MVAFTGNRSAYEERTMRAAEEQESRGRAISRIEKPRTGRGREKNTGGRREGPGRLTFGGNGVFFTVVEKAGGDGL